MSLCKALDETVAGAKACSDCKIVALRETVTSISSSVSLPPTSAFVFAPSLSTAAFQTLLTAPVVLLACVAVTMVDACRAPAYYSMKGLQGWCNELQNVQKGQRLCGYRNLLQQF